LTTIAFQMTRPATNQRVSTRSVIVSASATSKVASVSSSELVRNTCGALKSADGEAFSSSLCKSPPKGRFHKASWVHCTSFRRRPSRMVSFRSLLPLPLSRPGVNQRTSRSSHPRAWLQISSRRLISSLSASSETMSLSRSVALALLAQTEGVDISTEIAPPKKHPLTIRRILSKAVELWRGVSSHMLSVLRSWTSVLWLNASPAGSRHIKHLRRRNRGAEDEP